MTLMSARERVITFNGECEITRVNNLLLESASQKIPIKGNDSNFTLETDY